MTFTDCSDITNIHRALVDLKDEVNVLVDLDVEEGRTNTNLRTGNQFRLVVRRTKVVNLGVIQSYLEGKVSFSSDILEGLSRFPLLPYTHCHTPLT